MHTHALQVGMQNVTTSMNGNFATSSKIACAFLYPLTYNPSTRKVTYSHADKMRKGVCTTLFIAALLYIIGLDRGVDCMCAKSRCVPIHSLHTCVS